jgi:hypothetical protein
MKRDKKQKQIGQRIFNAPAHQRCMLYAYARASSSVFCSANVIGLCLDHQSAMIILSEYRVLPTSPRCMPRGITAIDLLTLNSFRIEHRAIELTDASSIVNRLSPAWHRAW